MAISLTTDWSTIRYIMICIYCTNALMATAASTLSSTNKQKRQLFREHLLPELGGKIPDSALIPERINLNRLNQNGFHSDGLYFEQRRLNQHSIQPFQPATLKIMLPPDNNHVHPAGRSYNNHLLDTTYLIREPVNYFTINPLHANKFLPLAPYTSLTLLHRYKQNKSKGTPWEDIFPPNGFPSQILAELAPYLSKLHEVNYE